MPKNKNTIKQLNPADFEKHLAVDNLPKIMPSNINVNVTILFI